MSLILRPYQREAVDAIPAFMEAGRGNPLTVLPTASGKSLVIGTFIEEAITKYPDTRMTCLAHVPELISQNYAELIGMWPDAPAGIYSAKLGMRQIGKQITFGGIQSIYKRAYELQRNDIVLVDEAHLISRKGETMYRRFLNDLTVINPRLKVCGFTATHFRMDSGMLHEGDDAMFDGISYEANVRDLIQQGYLCPPISVRSDTQIDTSKVGTIGGEFNAKQLEAVSSDPATVAKIVDEIIERGRDRRGWMVFGAGVKNCQQLRDALVDRGISAECIFGDTPAEERKWKIAAFKRQELRALVSMGVLTTGFNAKHVDLIAVPRATKSLVLWIQIIGRGMRLMGNTIADSIINGKADCLVLDFGGNIERHGPIDNPKYKRPPPPGEDKVAKKKPHKICPACRELCAIPTRECPACGFPFPEIASFVSTEASGGEIISDGSGVVESEMVPEWVDVTRVEYARHPKSGQPDSLRVIYLCGLMKHREWIHLERPTRPQFRAAEWWRRRAPPGTEIPRTVAEALQSVNDLSVPQQIAVRPSGKYTEIVGYRYFVPDHQSARVAA